MAKRIQRKRTNGWKMPEGAVYVGRPTIWGNPFKLVRPDLRTLIVESYWHLLNQKKKSDFRRKIQRELRGKDLVCWCKLSDPCHADVLLEIANS